MPSLRADGLLQDSRVYLSGPMDFVASRSDEKRYGWRNRVGDFLKAMGVTVFDPWFKPEVRGLHDYGREGEATTTQRDQWTYLQGKEGAKMRAKISGRFWPALHIDLRMVDTSDFVICYCPTNIYSVGTPHEIVVARQERKPVLFVSPHVVFPALENLRQHLKDDKAGTGMLNDLVNQVPIRENPDANPSLWYMPLIGGEHFFDGFGFNHYSEQFKWERIPLDDTEGTKTPLRPLLPFLEKANAKLPEKWDTSRNQFVANDDWILWDLKRHKTGADVRGETPRKKGR